MCKNHPIILKDFLERHPMRIVTDILNHAAPQHVAWSTPVMTPGALLVSAVACTKIRPVRGTGGPFRGDRN